MINWKLVYGKFIESRKGLLFEESQYTEVHHIVPKYEGVDNSEDNLIRLSLRDHALAHFILWRWKKDFRDKAAYLGKLGSTEEMRLALQEYVNQPEVKRRRVETMRDTKINMPDEEYYEKYVKPKLGENSSNYGKSRPGELAGNYGKSKGKYILIDPQGVSIEFKGIREIINFGVGETVIRSWRNKGVVKGHPNNSRSPWIGYEIQYKTNTRYGSAHKKSREVKRFK